MSERYLREHGNDVLDRVAQGETVIVTRHGMDVAELRPHPRRTPSAADLIDRRRHLPYVDPQAFRRGSDEVVDSSQ